MGGIHWLILMQHSLSSQALWDRLGTAHDEGWLVITEDLFQLRQACGAY